MTRLVPLILRQAALAVRAPCAEVKDRAQAMWTEGGGPESVARGRPGSVCCLCVCVGGGAGGARAPSRATCALRAHCAQPLKGSSQAKDRFPEAVRGSPQFPLLLSHCMPRGPYVTCASGVAFMSKSTEPTVRWLQWCHRAPETPQPHHPRTGKAASLRTTPDHPPKLCWTRFYLRGSLLGAFFPCICALSGGSVQ